MGKENIVKYGFLVRLGWKLIRPLFVAYAARTETPMDDEFIVLMDQATDPNFVQDVAEGIG